MSALRFGGGGPSPPLYWFESVPPEVRSEATSAVGVHWSGGPSSGSSPSSGGGGAGGWRPPVRAPEPVRKAPSPIGLPAEKEEKKVVPSAVATDALLSSPSTHTPV
eukprot:scaffold206909_cov27-Tisochrysis_lutea.AAC.2